MIRRPPRSTQGVSSAASDVYKRQIGGKEMNPIYPTVSLASKEFSEFFSIQNLYLSLIHISEPTRPLYISYAVFCLKKKKKKNKKKSQTHYKTQNTQNQTIKSDTNRVQYDVHEQTSY
eukprot:TRINITY_DN28174_c0_g1_i2.p2 TRINITY_DN28174_c0_g1~~TRINITY_DN28174_c0_g1_i2.p2  ORF type:complete len:118 (+),score=25.92 TRINITY_DN28174_c0_g1_i2:113-466(+)